MRGRLRSAVVLAALLAGAAWALTALEIETDITRFLPSGDDPRLETVARAVAASELNRTITITIGAPDVDAAATAAADLGARLAERGDVAWVRSGPDPGLQRAFYELYFPRRYAFAAADPAALSLDDGALGARARALKERLSLPTSPFTREIAADDPLLLFVEHLERLSAQMRGSLRVHDGALVTEDGAHGVVFLASRASAFDTVAASRLLQGIDEACESVGREHGGRLTFEQSGVHRFAVRAEAETRADVSRVSIAGALGVLVFLLVLFRSARLVLVGSVPLVAGVAGALVVSALAFPRIHGLTLAFGATLIGVAVDYVAHYLNHHVLAPAEGGAAATMRRVWPGLLLGALTTIAGLLGLAWTSFPAIRQMAVFTSSGVAVALITTRYVVPAFVHTAAPTRLHRALADRAARAMTALSAGRRWLWLIPAAVVAIVAGGAARLSVLDDVRVLNTQDPELLAEDERVRERVARVDAGRFVVAFGADLDSALARNDAVHGILEAAHTDGLLDQHRSAHALLRSSASQRASHEAVTSAPRLVERTAAAFEAEGFVAEAFAPFATSLERPPSVLTEADLEGTAVAPLVAPFLLQTATGPAVLTFVRGVDDPDALAERLAAVEGVLWFDQAAYMAHAYRDFRTRVQQLLGVGLLFVFALVFARYRRVGASLAAFLPAAAAGAATIGVVALAGEPITLMHVVSLLLVLSMGVDYGIFMVESERHEEGPAPTVVSLMVACASTVISFGALALSDQVALRAIGATTSIGVLLSLLLVPAAWLWVGRATEGRRRSRR